MQVIGLSRAGDGDAVNIHPEDEEVVEHRRNSLPQMLPHFLMVTWMVRFLKCDIWMG